MIFEFPEVTDFFKRDYFEEEDLQNLKLKISELYPTKQQRKAAISAINLKLVHYKLGGVSNLKKKEPQFLVSSSHKKSVIQNFLYLTVNKPLIKLAAALNVSNDFLIKTFELSSDVNLKKIMFTMDNWNAHKATLIPILKGVERQSKPTKLNRVKPSQMKYESSAGVYDAVKKNGGVGRVIYIRKK
ncbi:hypothetical protein MED134_07034 [Dokdonia sp. MED134]|uniref:hypothetical protein n=1 Tax=Dokdonia sp. MED134 TaxID=313590 RepID=UPI000068ABE7|nr:hypothetical protein [Dokdonia sp. MED134]EAQ40490.1 hypothetical protein MED134_07034 [Dokdonia sp. MED134]